MIRIVTDSASDLPPDLADRHSITVVPLTIRFGSEEFLDRLDLSPAQFWSRLRDSPVLPETAAPSVGRFREAFSGLAAQGAEGVVAICLSSQLSGTYQSAVLAAETMAGLPVKVVDSGAVSMAAGLQALHAAELAAAGAPIEQVAQAALAAAARANLLAALDTLEFLKRGGRIGAAQAMLGSVLSIKPLITFADGVVSPAGRVRTRSRAIEALVMHARRLKPRRLAVIHGGAHDIERLLDPLSETVPRAEIVVAEIGPVVGTHSGPGAIGVAYL